MEHGLVINFEDKAILLYLELAPGIPTTPRQLTQR
jgi:hypothetical protein